MATQDVPQKQQADRAGDLHAVEIDRICNVETPSKTQGAVGPDSGWAGLKPGAS
jgi:hypothetical protein